MEYGYGIQKLGEEIANRKAYDQKKLSIHFQNLESEIYKLSFIKSKLIFHKEMRKKY